MRDRALLCVTLAAIQEAGGQAHLVRSGKLRFSWQAGSLVLPGPGLNGQAVRDLIDDGWLREDGAAGTATLECWPNWAVRPDPVSAREP